MNQIPQWIKDTFGNHEWMLQNWKAVWELFPERPEEPTQAMLLGIGFQLKKLDVQWRSEDDLTLVLVALNKAGLAETKVLDDKAYTRRVPGFTYPKVRVTPPTTKIAPAVRSPATNDFLRRLAEHNQRTAS